MKSLPLHDQRYLVAAQGWFELGNHLEANEDNYKARFHTFPFLVSNE